jgi:hypothetical protein
VLVAIAVAIFLLGEHPLVCLHARGKRWCAERIFGAFQDVYEDFAIERMRQVGRINEWWAEAVG